MSGEWMRMMWTPWSCEKIHEWSWLFWWSESVVSVIPPVCNNDIEASVLYVVCICCLFGQWCSSEDINKNPREVVLIVLIIPIVELVALIIPVVNPITIVTFITMVTLTIQLNTISTVTIVTLLIIQLWHFFYSSEGADAETVPNIPHDSVTKSGHRPQDSWIPVDITNWGGNAIVPTLVLQRIFVNYNHISVLVIESSVHKSLQWIG